MDNTHDRQADALTYLQQDALSHVDMLAVLQRGTARVLAAQAQGVLIYEQMSHAHMLSARTPAAAEQLLDCIEAPVLAEAHQDFLAAMLAQRFPLRQTMTCQQAVWTASTPPVVPRSTFSVLPLTVSAQADVLAHYSHDIGADYIHGRLLAGEMFGAFSGDALAGFIGMHAEGAMGMLEVKPEYRRMGVASQLIAFLCDWLIKAGHVPFSQFTIENEGSRRLHEQLGFAITTECVYWLEP